MTSLIDSKIALQSNLARKGIALALQAPRALHRWRATGDDYEQHPPIIVDSIPKSGTHLLMQVARSIPNTQYFGSFVAWSSSLSLKKRSDQAMLSRLSRIAPGEVVGAHLQYSTTIKDALRQRNAAHWLIIRDPVDVLLSEAHYLRTMNRFHRMAREFRGLDWEQSIERALHGSSTRPDLYPHFEARVSPYLSWLKDNTCSVVRFELLRGAATRECEIQRLIAGWIDACHDGPSDLNRLTNQALAALDPAKSHTVSSRQKDREDEQRQTLAQNGSIRQLRRDMGYESDTPLDQRAGCA